MERSFQAGYETTLKFKTKVLFFEVMGVRIILSLRTQYMATCIYGQKQENMMPSKHVRTCHYVLRFIRKHLLLKINPNKFHTPGTTDKGKNKNIASSEGTPF